MAFLMAFFLGHFTPFWVILPFLPDDVINVMKILEMNKNVLFILQFMYHANFTSTWPLVGQITSFSVSQVNTRRIN